MAIHAVRTLEALSDRFRFHFFDVGRHTIARCGNTGVVIDSSSKTDDGAYIVQQGVKHSFSKRGKESVWEWIDAETMRITDGSLPNPDQTKANVFSHSFIHKGKPIFKGLIQWHLWDDDGDTPGTKYLVLNPNKNDRGGRVYRVVWREGIPGVHEARGTATTEKQCREALLWFVREYGDREQWALGACDEVYWRIWHNLNQRYNLPVLRDD
ncbi:hypothetical protein ACHAPU_009051 [Fusarium lateritium]